MYTVEKLRELGFHIWTDGNMVYTKRWSRGPVDKILVSDLLEEMKKNKAEVVRYLIPVTKERGPDGKPIFIFHRRNVPPPFSFPISTEPQQKFIENNKAKLVNLLESIFGSKKRALEELRKIKSDKNCATFYIGLLKLKKEKRRAFKSNSIRT